MLSSTTTRLFAQLLSILASLREQPDVDDETVDKMYELAIAGMSVRRLPCNEAGHEWTVEEDAENKEAENTPESQEDEVFETATPGLYSDEPEEELEDELEEEGEEEGEEEYVPDEDLFSGMTFTDEEAENSDDEPVETEPNIPLMWNVPTAAEVEQTAEMTPETEIAADVDDKEEEDYEAILAQKEKQLREELDRFLRDGQITYDCATVEPKKEQDIAMDADDTEEEPEAPVVRIVTLSKTDIARCDIEGTITEGDTGLVHKIAFTAFPNDVSSESVTLPFIAKATFDGEECTLCSQIKTAADFGSDSRMLVFRAPIGRYLMFGRYQSQAQSLRTKDGNLVTDKAFCLTIMSTGESSERQDKIEITSTVVTDSHKQSFAEVEGEPGTTVRVFVISENEYIVYHSDSEFTDVFRYKKADGEVGFSLVESSNEGNPVPEIVEAIAVTDAGDSYEIAYEKRG